MQPEQQNEKITPQVRVASYSNTTWQGAWRQRSRGVWGTGLFGVLWGAAVGGILSLTLLGLGAITVASAWTAIPVLMVGLAAAGGGIGVVIADSVGSAAGAVGAGMAEWESRFKQMMLEAGVFSKEQVQKEPISAALNRSEVIDTPEEVNLKGHNFKTIVNWPAMVTFVALGAAFGALLGSFGLVTIPAGLGIISSQAIGANLGIGMAAANALVGAGLVGGAASVFGLNSPVISNTLNNMFSKVFSGELFGKPKKPEIYTPVPKPVPSAAASAATVREALIVDQEQRIKQSKTQASFQERLEHERMVVPGSNQIH
ncbi:MAG: hypothetical protein K2X09_04885 [Rickettsiales bacterium]|nr:hypothetical protein [Rickettsiales bacterium]